MDLSILGQIAKIAILTLIAWDLTTRVIKGDEWRDFYSHLSLWLLLLGGATIGVVVYIWFLLDTYVPGMSLSWLNLFGSEGENVIGFSNEVKFLGILFLIILLFALPKLAIMEEEWFREGIQSWPEGIFRSIVFGMVHMIVGVPLGAGIALSVAGLVFTYQYFRGGVRLSALTHFHYNLLVVSFLMVSAILYSF